MTQSAREVLDRLAALRALDLRLAQREGELAKGPAAVREQTAAVAALDSETRALDERVRLLKAQIRLREGDLQSFEQKIQRLRDQSGQVRNNREFMAFRSEIANAQGDADRLQGEVLKILDVVQQAEGRIAALAPLRAQAQQRLDEARARVDGSLAGVRAERDQIVAERPGLLAGIGPETLDLYERARRSRGDALAYVDGEYCTGCGERQTRNDLYAVQNVTRIVVCTACRRILVAGSPP